MGLTKAQLEALNISSFPDNTEELITPEILRNYNSASIANTVNQEAYNVDSASFKDLINALDPSGSAESLVLLNDFTASQLTINSGYNTFTESADQRLNSIESVSGSWITESETGSFARVDVTNTFTQPQIINGAVTASSALISGLKYPTTDNGAKSFVQTDGLGNLTLQYVETIYETVRNSEATTILKGTPIYISGSTGDNGNAYRADAGIPSKMPALYIAGEDLTPGQTGLAIVLGLIEGVDTSLYPAGTEVFVGVGGGWTSTRPTGTAIIQSLGVVTKQGNGGQGVVLNPGPANLPNITQGYVWVGNSNSYPVAVATASLVVNVDTGSLVTTSSFNSYTSSTNSRLSNIESTTASLNSSVTQLNASSASQQVSINNLNTTTASLLIETQNLELFSASALTSISNLNQSSASQQQSIDALNQFTSSVIPTDTGSLLVTASFDNGTRNLTFTKGDATQFAVNIPDVSGSGTIDTGSFATTGSNAFIGTNSFDGQVSFTGSAPTILSSSFSGSLITNLTDTYTDIPEVKQIVTLTSASYAALFTSSLTDPNTLYVVSGSEGISSLPAGLLSSSVTNFVDYSTSVDSRINSIVTGTGFATTGSNTFLGTQIISGSETIVNYQNAGIQTLKLLPFVSSSAFNGNRDTVVIARYATGINNDPAPTSPVNIVFGANPVIANQTTITAQSIVSGSNNIITGTRTSATNTAEIQSNNSYITVFPSTRTPAYAPARISNSNINAQITTINNTSALSQSLSLGSVGFGFGFASNVVQSGIFGAITFNPNSGSTTFNQSINAGTLTVNSNKVNPDFITNGSALSIVNMLNAGTTTIIDVASGSYNAGFTSFNRNILGGVVTLTNTREATTNANFQNAIVVGSNLIVTGSDSQTGTAGGGSAFFGRYNLNDGITNNTSNTVFAVGAGTIGNLKTPLWVGVDQSVNITGSLFVNGVSISGGGSINTGSFATTGSNSFNGNQTITGSVNIKGNTTFTSVGGDQSSVIIGSDAMMSSVGNNGINVAIGNSALKFSSGSTQNVAIGNRALFVSTGSLNVSIGSETMVENTTGFNNVAIGVNALNKNTTGNSNFGLGVNSLQFNTEGNANIAVGAESAQFASGSSNTFIGHRAGKYVTGTANTIIGGFESTSGSILNNNIILADGVGNVRAQYSGSAWSFQDGIKLNKGTNKPCDIVTVNEGNLVVNNSLVTVDSIILLTVQNDEIAETGIYFATVANKTTGSFTIQHNYGAFNLKVAYLIINPT